jgi:hypothetical protein
MAKQTREELLSKKRQYYHANKHKLDKQKIKHLKKKYYQENKQKWLDNDSIVSNHWYHKNKERALKNRAAYYQKHKAELTKKHRERYQKDLKFRITERLRGRLRDALVRYRDKRVKLAPTLSLLDCSMDEFICKIEKQFADGMNWDNYGSIWHIDHIRPIASFDLTMKEDQLKCFHYSNLRPLFAKENLSKGCKYEAS